MFFVAVCDRRDPCCLLLMHKATCHTIHSVGILRPTSCDLLMPSEYASVGDLAIINYISAKCMLSDLHIPSLEFFRGNRPEWCLKHRDFEHVAPTMPLLISVPSCCPVGCVVVWYIAILAWIPNLVVDLNGIPEILEPSIIHKLSSSEGNSCASLLIA